LKQKSQQPIQKNLFGSAISDDMNPRFISTFRVTLVKDGRVDFGQCKLVNSDQSHQIIRKLIETQGQPDREQFIVVLLNAKNDIIGLNIVATGGLTSTQVSPREVLKPAIISNSAAMILCHNHPSNDVSPSQEDIAITTRIVQAANIIGIQVHEHLIISIQDDRYYSFADNGIIKRIYDSIG